MLEILTAAETVALVELATVKAHMRPAVTGTSQDARLTAMIRWASAAIGTHCRRTFARQEYRQTLPGTGSQHLMLGVGPVECDADRLLPSLTLNGSEITDYRVESVVAALLWRESGWPQARGRTGKFSTRSDDQWLDREAIVAGFWAGYLMPGEDDIDGAYRLPDDVERAALVTVIEWNREDARDAHLASTSTSETDGETTRSISASFVAPDPAAALRVLPAAALALLRDYRR